MPNTTRNPAVTIECPQCQREAKFTLTPMSEPLLHHHFVCDGCDSVLKIERVDLQLRARVVQSGNQCANGNCGD